MNTNFRYVRGTLNNDEAVEFDITENGTVTTCTVTAQRLLCGIRKHTCTNGKTISLSDEDMLAVLEVLKKERDAIKFNKDGNPKTLEGWRGSGLNLGEYLAVGDEVDEQLVDEMLDCVPPHRFNNGYLQVGEPYADALNESGEQPRYRPTYATFHKITKDGRTVWIYAGHCFTNETTNRMPEKDVAGGLLRELRAKLGIKKSESASNATAQAINGEIRCGDYVIAADNNDYFSLVGEITEIIKHGTPEHTAENDTDCVHVNFKAFSYPEWRANDIAEHFEILSNAGDASSYDDLPLDDVIMAPDMLIRITELSEDKIDELVCDFDEAKLFCDGVQGVQGGGNGI